MEVHSRSMGRHFPSRANRPVPGIVSDFQPKGELAMPPDPDTMIERHRRMMRMPWLTMNKLMIVFGIALTVLAFFFALSGCPTRKAHGAEPSHLTDPEIIVIDVHDPDSIRAAMDGAGYARVELDPNRY